MSKLPREGYLRSEVVELLQREGYDVSFEQLRKYETYGLFSPTKSENKYRIYTEEIVDSIRRVFWLKIIGISLRRIKEFIDTEDQILNSRLLNKREASSEHGPGGKKYIKELPPLDVIKGKSGVEYSRFFRNAEKYTAMCNEIEERIRKVSKILEIAGNDNARRKMMAQKLSQVED